MAYPFYIPSSSSTNLQIPNCAFGKAKWATYFGDIGIEPPLPADIHQILQGPCPIWPGKTVEQTHILTLIPARVDGKPLTLKTLGELIENPKQGPATKYGYFELGEYQDSPTSRQERSSMGRVHGPSRDVRSFIAKRMSVN